MDFRPEKLDLGLGETPERPEKVQKAMAQRMESWKVTLLAVTAVASGVAIVWVYLLYDPVKVSVEKIGAFQEQPHGGEVVNHFQLKVKNRSSFRVRIPISTPMEWADNGVGLITPDPRMDLAAGEDRTTDIYLQFPRKLLKDGSGSLDFILRGEPDGGKPLELHVELDLSGPSN